MGFYSFIEFSFVNIVCLYTTFLQRLQMLRLHLRDKYSKHQQEELGCRLLKIAFRLPDASKLEHSFHPTDATKVEKCMSLPRMMSMQWYYLYLYRCCMSLYISHGTKMMSLASISHSHVCSSLVPLNKQLVKPSCKDYLLLMIRREKNRWTL